MDEATKKLDALRADLGVLNILQSLVGESRVQAKEHEMAGRVLGWLEVRIKAAEAELAALLPPPTLTAVPEPEPETAGAIA